jgi:hypothetical protein
MPGKSKKMAASRQALQARPLDQQNSSIERPSNGSMMATLLAP